MRKAYSLEYMAPSLKSWCLSFPVRDPLLTTFNAAPVARSGAEVSRKAPVAMRATALGAEKIFSNRRTHHLSGHRTFERGHKETLPCDSPHNTAALARFGVPIASTRQL